MSTNFKPNPLPLISTTNVEAEINRRKEAGDVLEEKGAKEVKKCRVCVTISPTHLSFFIQLITTLHEVTRTSLCTKRKIDNLFACAPINPERKLSARDRPVVVNYSKTRACPRIPISEMEDLIYYSASRIVAGGVFVYLSTRMRNY